MAIDTICEDRDGNTFASSGGAWGEMMTSEVSPCHVLAIAAERWRWGMRELGIGEVEVRIDDGARATVD